MREEQQRDRERNRVTRRGGTKIFGKAAAPQSATRIHAFDDDKQQDHDAYDAPRARAESGRAPRDDRYHRNERDARGDRYDRGGYDDRDYRDSRRYRDDREERYARDDRDRRYDERARDDARRYYDDNDYRDNRRYRDERDARDDRYARDDRDSRRYEPRDGYRDSHREEPRREEPRREDKPRAEQRKKPAAAPAANTELFAHQVVPYVMFWVALFAAVSFILRDLAGLSASAGAFGNWLADFLCGLLGLGAYVLPLFLVVLSLKWKRFVREGVLGKKIFLSAVFLMLLSGIIHVFQDVDRARKITAPAILYAEGVARGGGGFFGGFVGEWLGLCLRLPGTCLLAIPLLIIIGIYLVGLTPSGLWQRMDAKMKMARQRRREERGANGGKIAAPAPRATLGKGEEGSEATWKEPQPLSRSAAPMYDFREDEPDVKVEIRTKAPSARKETEEAAPAARQRPRAAETVRAHRNSEVHEILDIPDDEPEILEPSVAARVASMQADHVDDAKRQVDDILRDMASAATESTSYTPASAPAAQTPAPAAPAAQAAEEDSSYYAPFALPVRPEPKRERAAEQNRAHIVIQPHAAQASAPVAEASSYAAPTSETAAEESLGNLRADSYRPAAPYQPKSTPAPQRYGSAYGNVSPTAVSAARTDEWKTSAAPAPERNEPVREEVFGTTASAASAPAAPAASAPTVSARSAAILEDLWQEDASAPETKVPEAHGVLESLFEDEDEIDDASLNELPDYTPAVAEQKPAASVFVDDTADLIEKEAEVSVDVSAPAPAVSSLRERVDPTPAPAFAPTPAFAAHVQKRYEPPRSPIAVKAEPVREEAPPAPEPVRREYVRPPIKLLNEDKTVCDTDSYEDNEETKQILRDTLESFNVHIKDEVTCSRGPTITRYEVRPEIGVPVRSIINRIDDISLYMEAQVRIAPIQGKAAVGVEVPNKVRETVYLRSLLESEKFQKSTNPVEVALGVGIGGEIQMCDLTAMPHLLVAGATKSGKSVCINTIILSLLYKTSPEDLRLILIDPKRVEFKPYMHLPHLYAPIITEPARAVGALACAVQEMERRYTLLEDVGARNFEGYNERVKNDPDREHLPYIVIIIDEYYDLKMACPNNDLENFACRLAQKARAAGIHLIIGTQRPSVNVITGTLKANIPSRIAFTVMQQVDSRTILDAVGAELLTGRGDMLYAPMGEKPIRLQGSFVSDDEVESIVNYVRDHNDPVQYNQTFMDQVEIEMAKAQNNGKKNDVDNFIDEGDDDEDPKFVDAVKLAVETQKVATSLLQRRLGVGYGRAAKIIDRMEELGLVSASEGNKPRQVLPMAQGYLNHLFAEEDDGNDDFNDYQ